MQTLPIFPFHISSSNTLRNASWTGVHHCFRFLIWPKLDSSNELCQFNILELFKYTVFVQEPKSFDTCKSAIIASTSLWEKAYFPLNIHISLNRQNPHLTAHTMGHCLSFHPLLGLPQFLNTQSPKTGLYVEQQRTVFSSNACLSLKFSLGQKPLRWLFLGP